MIEKLIDQIYNRDTRILTSEYPDEELAKIDIFFKSLPSVEKLLKIDSFKHIRIEDKDFFLVFPEGASERTGGVFINPAVALKEILETLMPFYTIKLITHTNYKGKLNVDGIRIYNLIDPNEYNRQYMSQIINILENTLM